jgi:hypothetical protein
MKKWIQRQIINFWIKRRLKSLSDYKIIWSSKTISQSNDDIVEFINPITKKIIRINKKEGTIK